MKIGDKVTAKNRLTRLYRRDGYLIRKQFWLPFSELAPVPLGVYLGKVTLYNGDRVWVGEEEGYVFERASQVSAVVVQPIDAGNRYRRPVYALPEDVEAVQP